MPITFIELLSNDNIGHPDKQFSFVIFDILYSNSYLFIIFIILPLEQIAFSCIKNISLFLYTS